MLAQREAPVEGRDLWAALLDKTEYPENYSERVSGAEVIDHDARTVVRRTWVNDSGPCIEWVRHEVRNRRVECTRSGQGFRRAQALVDTPEPCGVPVYYTRHFRWYCVSPACAPFQDK